MKECRYCFKNDLADLATKCPHCGAWLEGSEGGNGDFNELRRELQKELRDDRLDYQEYMKSIFNRVQFAATIILTLVIGASAWFGFRTDRSISEIKEEITGRIEAEFHAQKTQDLLGDTIESTVDEMKPGILKQMDLQIRDQTKQVADEMKNQVSERAKLALEEVNQSTQEAKVLLAGTMGEITALKEELGPAREELSQIRVIAQSAPKAIIDAVQAPVEKITLPVDSISLRVKGGIRRLPRLMQDKPNALKFNVGFGGYYGPAIWFYLDNLSSLPEFRYVVLISDDRLFGIYDAMVLVSFLNPPNSKELSQKYPLSDLEEPEKDEVPKWVEFAELLKSNNKERLAALPGFVPAREAVPLKSDKREVLTRMQAEGFDWLPVVDENNPDYLGVITHSRLTASLLLEIASGVKAPN